MIFRFLHHHLLFIREAVLSRHGGTAKAENMAARQPMSMLFFIIPFYLVGAYYSGYFFIGGNIMLPPISGSAS